VSRGTERQLIVPYALARLAARLLLVLTLPALVTDGCYNQLIRSRLGKPVEWVRASRAVAIAAILLAGAAT